MNFHFHHIILCNTRKEYLVGSEKKKALPYIPCIACTIFINNESRFLTLSTSASISKLVFPFIFQSLHGRGCGVSDTRGIPEPDTSLAHTGFSCQLVCKEILAVESVLPFQAGCHTSRLPLLDSKLGGSICPKPSHVRGRMSGKVWHSFLLSPPQLKTCRIQTVSPVAAVHVTKKSTYSGILGACDVSHSST